MTARRRFLALVVSALFALVAGTALAADTAEGFVKDHVTELRRLLKDDANQGQVDAVFDQMLDYDALAHDSLGKHWDEITPAQQAEFSSVLKELVRTSYRKNLKKTLDYSVAFKGEKPAKKATLVLTVAKGKNVHEEPFSIDYLCHQVDGEWRVMDIRTEGSSLVGGYRSQFNRSIKKDGFDALLAKMKKKLEKEQH